VERGEEGGGTVGGGGEVGGGGWSLLSNHPKRRRKLSQTRECDISLKERTGLRRHGTKEKRVSLGATNSPGRYTKEHLLRGKTGKIQLTVTWTPHTRRKN